MLGKEQNKRFVEHSALFQIFEQSGCRLIYGCTAGSMIAVDVIVSIPWNVADRASRSIGTRGKDLYEANAALDQAAGNQALSSVVL